MALTTEFQKIGTGTAKSFNYATGYLELWAKHNGQEIANNRTSVTVELRLVVSGGYIGNYQSTYWSIGGSLSNSGDIGSGSHRSQTLGSATGYVGHNADGTGSVSFSGGFNPTAWGITLDVSGSATLPTIPRASGVSCSSPYIGDTATITIDRKSSSFTHTVSYHIDSLTATLADKTSSTVLSFNTNSIKSQIYALMPNAKSIAGTIRCRTYSGNTKIGDTQVANFNLYAKENECKPDVSGTVIDTNQDTINLTGDNTILIRNASKPKVTVSATPKYSSTISGYSINLNDGQTANNQEYTFDTINSNSITVSATDSRTYNTSNTIDLSNRMINYIKLAFNEINLQRTESTSNEVILNATGAFYNGNFKSGSHNLRNIVAGDNLSGKTLYFDFPSIVSEEESYTILSTNNNKGINYRGGESAQDVVLNDDGTIYLAMYGNKHLEESYTQINLSNNFGTVEYIDANSEIYPYIYIQEGESTSNSLNCSFMYRESGTDTWINGGTITPTITNNTFSFTNLSLGNIYNYEKEYQFKIIAQDLLMTIGNETKDIQTVTKGVAVVEIGDGLVNVNGNFTINDKSVDYIVESGTSGIWKYRKWNSGLAECWGTETRLITTSRTWGPLYRGDAFSLAYPFTFVEVPQETYGFSSNVTALALTYSQNSTTNTATYNASYYNQNSEISINLNLYVRGRWK